ncbi:MAG: signal peptidase II [Byssovorax sp.]
MSDEAHSPESSPEADPSSSGTSEPGAPSSAAPTSDAAPDPEPAAAPNPEVADAAKVEVEVAPKPAVVAPPSMRPNYVFLGLVSILTLAADLGSKIWAKGHLEDAKSFADRHVDVVPHFMSLTFAANKGGAWGLLQGEPESVRRPFFFSISLLAVIFIVSLYRRLAPDQTALKWGLPLVLGGALGNLVNRIQYNFVVDFIDVYAKWGGENHHWPTFNIADVAIVAGVGLMAIDMFTSRKPKAPAPAATAEEAHRAP